MKYIKGGGGESVISPSNMARKGLTDTFCGYENVEKTFLFCVSIQIVICSYFKGNTFTVVKRNKKFQTRFVKGGPFINKRYTKRIPYLPKWYITG